MSEEISFIHAADLHLDSPFKGLANVPERIFHQIRNSTFHALDRLIHTAIEKDVDFILLAGDLFDNEKQSLRAQLHLKKAFEKLKEHEIPVYMSYGNHDYINGNQHPVTYPENVHIFPDETVRSFIFTKNGKELARIYGFSYEERAVTENKTGQYVIKNKQIPFHIAMLHGSVAGDKEHDVYAPFERKELLESDFDYWALGHIHKRQMLHQEDPIIVYPGNIQGRNRKETGEKGCYYVRLSKTASELSFTPLQSILFAEVTLDVTNCSEVHQVEKVLSERLEKLSASCPQLIDLTLTSRDQKIKQWESEQLLSEIVSIVNEANMDKQNWQYIYKTETVLVNHISDEILIDGDHFLGELVRQFETTEIDSFLTDLYEHRQGRKMLSPMTQGEKEKVKEKAKQLLIHELLKGVQE